MKSLPRLMAAFLAAFPAAAFGDAAGDEGFTGSSTCQGCHAAAWQAWRDSDHYRSMLPASEETVLGDFSGQVFEYAGLAHRFFREGERFLVETDDAQGRLQTFEIAYTFGFEPLQQYLVAFPDGRFQALGIAWDDRARTDGGQRWYHLYPGETVTSDDPLHWSGAFQNWNSRCAACHSTGLTKNYDAAQDRYATRWAEVNVACESCHGPGAAHAGWASGDRSAKDPGFVNSLPAAGHWTFVTGQPTASRGTPAAPVPVGACAGCHARRAERADAAAGAPFGDLYQLRLLEDGLYYADGQVLDEVYEHGSFLQSRMHAAGVTCTDCHEPHSGRIRAEGNALCGRCHQPGVFDQPSHHHHAAGSAGSMCVECHMPATTYMGIDARRDHGIRVPDPRLTVELGIPNACNRCHADQDAAWAVDAFGKAYPAARRRSAHAPVLAEARANRRTALPGLIAVAADPDASGIVRATALLETARFPSEAALSAARDALSDGDPLVRAAAVRALEGLPAPQRYALLEARVADPVRAVRAEVASLLADVPADQLSEAGRTALVALRKEYRAALQHSADMPEGQLNLGMFLQRSGEPAMAERAYRKALDLSPGFLPAMINLADLYRENGMDQAAGDVLAEAIRRYPAEASALHALGLLRVRENQLPAAVDLLGRAAAAEPSNPRYAYVYGVALYESGRQRDAVGVLEQAWTRHPGDPEIGAALAAYYDALGEIEKLRRLQQELP